MADLPTGVEIHNGKIRISFSYRGVRCREVLRGWATTAANLKKAGNLRSAIVGEIQFGNFDYAARFPESKAVSKFTTTRRVSTFSELCDVFLNAKSLELTAASHDSLSSKINTLLRTVGGGTLLTDIQYSDLLQYRQDLLTGGVVNPKSPWFNKQGRAASTVNNIMGSLCEMLRLANQSQFISHSPYDNVKPLRVSKKDPDPLLSDEYQKLMGILPRRFALLWTIAVHTGMRHGELCALAWEDVDLEKGEINVRRNLTAKGLFVPPKTAAGIRKITMLRPALDAITEQFDATGRFDENEITFNHREHGKTETQQLKFVFRPGPQTRFGSPYFAKRSITYSWDSGLEKAGVRKRHAYQSRHTYACWLLSAGANPSFIASQMGHENAKMVYEVYSKWIGEMNRDQVGMLNDKLPGVLSP